MSPAQSGGHLAIAKNKNVGKVMVLHAWWGLNDTIKQYCDRLASEGFTIFAPDLYHGKLTDEIETAEIYSNDLSLEQAHKDLEGALEFLKQQVSPGNEKIAMIGFSLGAFLALDFSTLYPEDIHQVVVYYGTGPDDYSNSKASYLGHFAQYDVFEPESNVNELGEVLRKSERPYTFYLYPDTSHWFCEPDRVDAYNEEAASLAWERTLEFLRKP